MIIEFEFPDRFVPQNKEFIYYCAIKLYKNNLINKEEALKICKLNEREFENIIMYGVKRFKSLCGDGYNDED